MKKTILALLVMSTLSSLAFSACPDLAGEYNECTTGDAEFDELRNAPSSIKISQKKAKQVTTFTISYDKTGEWNDVETGKFVTNKKASRTLNYSNLDLDIKLDVTAKCFKDEMILDFKYNKIVPHDKSIKGQALKLLSDYVKLELGEFPAQKMRVEKDELVINSPDYPYPLKCQKVK